MDDEQDPFRIAAVPGVTLTKWTRAWQERRPDAPLQVLRSTAETQSAVLHDDTADVSFVRLAGGEDAGSALDALGADDLSAITLYVEAPVVVVPKEHPLAELDSVTLADLEAENHLAGEWEDAIDLVAANVGVVIVPQSIARLHARKDVAAVPVTDAAETRIAIAWLMAQTTERVEEFVGIVRGRTAQSSRSTPTPPTPRLHRRKRSCSRARRSSRPGAPGRRRTGGRRGADARPSADARPPTPVPASGRGLRDAGDYSSESTGSRSTRPCAASAAERSA